MDENFRTQIFVEDNEKGRIRVKLMKTPDSSGKPVKGRVLKPLRHRLSLDDGTVESARGYGAELHDVLWKAKDMRAIVKRLLDVPGGAVRPICFMVEGGPSQLDDQWMWEALWVEGKEFLALHPQWPIARLVETPTTARVYHAPLRVLAIMSAHGVSARGDWEGIKAAVESVRTVRPGGGPQERFPVHVTAVVAERELLAEMRELQAELERQNDNWLTVVGLAGQETIDEQFAAEPHVIHFFCHGNVEFGGGVLSMATMSDRAEDDPEHAVESVVVSLGRLQQMVRGRKLWLVTFNCCSGASSAGPIHSLAHATVDAGAGAALGWRTAISPQHARVLSRTVYAALFRQLRDVLNRAQPQDTVTVELATLGYDLRDALRNRHQDLLDWALPVLYVAHDPLAVVVATAQPDNPDDLRELTLSPTDKRVIADTIEAQVLKEMAQLDPILAALVREVRAAGEQLPP
jgi:hypothetical protein